jgi:hypothetical protein
MMLGTLEKLRDSLGTGQSHPDKDVMRLIGSARRTGPGPRPSPPRPSEAAQVADNIESYARKLIEDSDKINGFLDEAPLLKTELSPTVAGSQEIIRKFTSSIFEMGLQSCGRRLKIYKMTPLLDRLLLNKTTISRAASMNIASGWKIQ